jgi:hypothetical protein
MTREKYLYDDLRPNHPVRLHCIKHELQSTDSIDLSELENAGPVGWLSEGGNRGVGRLLRTGALIVRGPFDVELRLPDDIGERLRNRRLFWRAKLAWAVSDFNTLKGCLTDRRSGEFLWPAFRWGPSNGDAVADLKFLQETVTGLRRIVAELDARLAVTAEAFAEDAARDARRQADDKKFQEHMALTNTIRDINI